MLRNPSPSRVPDEELIQTVARMEHRLRAVHSELAQRVMGAYGSMAERFESDLAPSVRDIALAKSGALMLAQALIDGAAAS
jgi:hypothetical protein